MSLTHLSLFTGIGGIDLGLDRAGIATVGMVERDPYCRRILAQRWRGVPTHDDVTTITPSWIDTLGRIDVNLRRIPLSAIQPGRKATRDRRRPVALAGDSPSRSHGSTQIRPAGERLSHHC